MVCGFIGIRKRSPDTQSGHLKNIHGSSVFCFDGLSFMSLFLSDSILRFMVS